MPSVNETNSNSPNHSLREFEKSLVQSRSSRKTDVDRSEGNGTERGTREDNVDATIVANGTRTKKRKRKKAPYSKNQPFQYYF